MPVMSDAVGEVLEGGPGAGAGVAVDRAGVAPVLEQPLERLDGVDAGVAVDGTGVAPVGLEVALERLPAVRAELPVDGVVVTPVRVQPVLHLLRLGGGEAEVLRRQDRDVGGLYGGGRRGEA